MLQTNTMIRLLLLLLSLFVLQTAHASGLPIKENQLSNECAVSNKYPQPLLTDYKLNTYYTTYLPVDDSTHFARLKRKAKWVKWLGIGSLGSLLLPVVGFLSLPSAIVSLIMGGQVKRQTTDPNILKDVSIGKKFSIVTIVLLVAAAIIALLVVLLLIRLFGGWR